jgi:hypothetical protein
MAVSAGTAFLDVVPRLQRDFSKQLSSQMLAPMAQSADQVGTQSGRRLGTKLTEGLRAPLRQAGGIVAGAFAVKKVFDFFQTSITEGRESNRVAAQTEAVIRSTGGAAKVTTQQVSDLAAAISNKTGKDDEAIQAGANMILTFTGIKNAAGANNDIFNQTVQVTEDMTAAFNDGQITQENMRKTAVQVGKALNDPINGLTALRRVGVSFTEQQKAQITALVKSGHTLEAQKIILAELRKEFGGSAEASATAADKLAVHWKNFQEAIGLKLIPIIDRAATMLVRFSDATSGIGPTVVVVGAAVAGLATLVLGSVVKILAARDAWNAYKLSKLEQVGVDAAVGDAEVGLAAKTAASGGAMTAGSSGLGSFVRTAGLAIPVIGGLAWLFGKAQDSIKHNTSIVGELTGSYKKNTTATKEQAAATGDNAEKSKALAVRLAAQNKVQADAKAATDKYNLALKTEGDTIAGVIPEFDGYTAKSKLTAAQIVKNLRQEVGSYTTWAKDVQTLLHRGADPKFIAELSTKGPAYVHAMATGSNRELRLAQGFFHDRMGAIKQLSVEQLRLTGVEAPKALADGLTRSKPVVIHATAGLAASVRNGTARLNPELFAIGHSAAQGLADGVNSKKAREEVRINSANVALYLSTTMSKTLGIHSPSTVAYHIGEQYMIGLIQGIASKGAALNAAAAAAGTSGAVALGKALAAQRGWTGSQWDALYQLWAHESGWRWNADNPTSSAYGIPQALPGSKMASAGADWRTNPRTQELWGMNYIADRYGNPVNAWAAWLSRSPHWYGSGLWPTTFTSPTLIGVGERGPETVSVTPGYGTAGPTVVNIYPAPGMSERRVGQIVVEALEARDRRARKGGRP